MKFFTSVFLLFITIHTFGCSCYKEWSFCHVIKSGSFFQQSSFEENGIVCIIESTGNVFGDYDFSAAEVKIVELLYGEVQPGYGNYLNTDSTIWILAGQGATCYESAYSFSTPGTQYMIASVYEPILSGPDLNKFGYSLFFCQYDVFRCENDTLVGPFINDFDFYNPTPLDTIAKAELPDIINDCIYCEQSLNLPDTHNYPSTYLVNNSISSTATVNSNVTYKANDRVTLQSGFNTNAPYNFSVEMEGCN